MILGCCVGLTFAVGFARLSAVCVIGCFGLFRSLIWFRMFGCFRLLFAALICLCSWLCCCGVLRFRFFLGFLGVWFGWCFVWVFSCFDCYSIRRWLFRFICLGFDDLCLVLCCLYALIAALFWLFVLVGFVFVNLFVLMTGVCLTICCSFVGFAGWVWGCVIWFGVYLNFRYLVWVVYIAVLGFVDLWVFELVFRFGWLMFGLLWLLFLILSCGWLFDDLILASWFW